MGKLQRVEIKRGESSDGRQVTQIYIDGHKLRGVRSFKLEQDTHLDIPVLTLHINALDISIDTPMSINHAGLGGIKEIIFDNESWNKELNGEGQNVFD